MRFPSRPWVEKRLAALREPLERRSEASALVLRRLLDRMVLKPVYPEPGKPYYVARTAIDVLVRLEPPGSDPSSDPGANVFEWWTRSQRSRTLARLELQVAFLPPQPIYQGIASEVAVLYDRDPRLNVIARHLGVDDHTVAKALRWLGKR